MLLGDGPQYCSAYSVIVRNLAKQFRRRGVEVAMMALQNQGSPLWWRSPDGDFYQVYEGGDTLLIEKGFKDFAPDMAIHVRDAFYGDPVHHQPAYRLMGLRYRPKTLLLYTPVQADMLPDTFLDVCLHDATSVVTMTDWSQAVLSFQGVPPGKLDVAYGGFDPEVYRPMPVKKEDFGFDPNKLLVGMVAVNNQPRKNWPVLLKAASILRRKMDVELYLHTGLVGASFDIRHFIDKLGLKGSVHVPQGVTTWGESEATMAAVYNCMDAYCSPSSEEGFNMPILEALACGASVVASDHPNHREVLGAHGFLAPTSRDVPSAWSFAWNTNAEALAGQLELALQPDEDPHDREAQVMYARERFSWEKVTDQWFSIFEKHKTEWGIAPP